MKVNVVCFENVQVLVVVIASEQKTVKMAFAPFILDHKLNFFGAQLREFHLVCALFVHADGELLLVVYENDMDIVVVAAGVHVHFYHLVSAGLVKIVY